MKPLHADNAQVMTAPVAQDRSSVIELLTYATGETSLGSFLVRSCTRRFPPPSSPPAKAASAIWSSRSRR